MKPNAKRVNLPDVLHFSDQNLRITSALNQASEVLAAEVVDHSLSSYGLEKGDLVFYSPNGSQTPDSIEVWELDGNLQIRHLRPWFSDWYEAYTKFQSSEILFTISPEQYKNIRFLGRTVGFIKKNPEMNS